MEKLSYGDAVRFIREAVAEHPEGTNPLDQRGLCLYSAKNTTYKQRTSARPNCIVGTVLVKAELPLPDEESGWWSDPEEQDGWKFGAARPYIEAEQMSKHTALLLSRVQRIFDKHSANNQTWGGTWADAFKECQTLGYV